MGGASGAVSNFVSDVTGSDTLGAIIAAPFDPLSGNYILAGQLLDKTGSILGSLGLDSLGKELGRWGDMANQTGLVMQGQYHKDMKEIDKFKKNVDNYGFYINDRANGLNSKVAAYKLTIDELVARLERLVAFDEIFHMAMKNRIRNAEKGSSAFESEYVELEILVKEYELMQRMLEQMIANLKNTYDFVIGLTEGSFLQRLVGSIIMVIGGITYSLGAIAHGKATSDDWKQIITVVIIVIAVILTWGAAIGALAAIATGGSALAAGLLVASAVLATIGAIMQLDGMYANGAATGAIMSSLDFLFNDVLQLDSLLGSDFEKFDKDHEDYQEMVGYIQIAIAVATVLTAWSSSMVSAGTGTSSSAAQGAKGGATQGATQGFSIFKPSTWNMGTAAKYGTDIGSSQTSMLAAQDAGFVTNTKDFLGGAIQVGNTIAETSLFGIEFSTYQTIYDAYTTAMNVNDFIAANDQFERLKNKLSTDIEKVNKLITKTTNKKMMASYKDAAYFLQDQQEYIDRYVWSMTSQNMYVDPYGTTPVANIRFTPDKDVRGFSFGFEDLFDESTLAGSKGYFNNIIYGS